MTKRVDERSVSLFQLLWAFFILPLSLGFHTTTTMHVKSLCIHFALFFSFFFLFFSTRTLGGVAKLVDVEAVVAGRQARDVALHLDRAARGLQRRKIKKPKTTKKEDGRKEGEKKKRRKEEEKIEKKKRWRKRKDREEEKIGKKKR